MKNFKILIIKKKSSTLKKFLESIKDKNFLVNKSFNNTPWINFKNPNFKFYKIVLKKKIVGIVVIIYLKLNTHLQFFYISSKYRSQGLGKEILKQMLSSRKFTTVHVPKKLNIRTQNFYKKNSFKVATLNEKHKLIKYWIARCKKFDTKTFKEKKLLYKNLK